MTLTAQQLNRIMPKADAATWLAPLEGAMAERAIVGWVRAAAFLAQVAHESGECTRVEERLGYSAERIRLVWKTRFASIEAAKPYAYKPEALANHVYCDRMGNGPEASGDGWRYRGRGLIQLTGRDNYFACGKGLGFDLLAQPELLTFPVMAARSAAWVWHSRGLNALADAGGDTNFRRITEAINGGLTGLDARTAYWEKAKEALR